MFRWFRAVFGAICPTRFLSLYWGGLRWIRALQGQGIGRLLVRDAALRVWQAAESIGIRGFLVHAISDAAMSFYRSIGFVPSPLSATALVITLADLKNSL
ncbi:MAG: GNAT family N-acetyltransferase [Azoarcus sp.]|nr:GNAT family N-acetyltransferase [Azoarcus sp.]